MFKEANSSIEWDQSINEEDVKWLISLQKKYSFLPCCRNLENMLLRPVILDQVAYQQMQNVAANAIRITVEVFKKTYTDAKALAKENGIDSRLMDFFTDSLNSNLWTLMMARPDIIIDKNGNIKVIELNIEPSIGGLVDCTVLPDEYINGPSGNKVIKKTQLRFDRPLVEMAAMLRNLWGSLGNNSTPNVALIEYQYDVLVNQLQAEILSGMGVSTSYVRPWELNIKAGEHGLYYGNKLIDIAIRNFPLDVPSSDEEILSLNTLLKSYQDKHAFHLPGDATSIIANKKSFALVWEHIEFLSMSDQLFVKNHIPYTKLLTKKTLERHEAFGNKDLWVLKKSIGHGGKDVLIGKDAASDKLWNQILNERASSREYVMQNFIEPSQVVLPFVKQGCLYKQKVDIIFGQYVFGDRAGGTLVRFKNSDAGGAINVSRGTGACFCLIKAS
ncbi:MAG: hypothetical protein ABIE74_05175 [Pseudomonadota bacterium]